MRLTIKKKLGGLTIFTMLVFAIITGLSAVIITNLIRENERLVNEEVAEMDAAMESSINLGLAIQAYKNYLVRADEKYIDEFRRFTGEIDKGLAKYLEHASGEEKALGDKAKAQLTEYRKSIDTLVAARSASNDIAAVDRSIKGVDREIRITLEEMDKSASASFEKARAEAAAAAHKLLLLQVACAVVAAILLALVSIAIMRGIFRALKTIGESVERIADGDLTQKAEIVSDDELGDMGRDFNRMVDSMSAMISTITCTSSQLAAAANQLQGTAVQIATGAEEVACQAGTVATAAEEMSATSGDIAQNCQSAAEGGYRANSTATAGAEVVNATVQVMNRIAGRVHETARSVESLGSRSDQIGEIIGTIEDIADQTNLLALNAAIEAARAGEQGRGFAVVADEVRALAERTTKATREIGDMIKAIQSETRSAVTAMEEGVQEVESGTTEAARSGQSLQAILEQINTVTMQVNQIATAAEEQTATTGEITSNIHQITEIVQETARGAQESATAAGQLAGLATELQRRVGQFRLAA
ncbi:MAG: methyl-accepting chemotaxis protein [Geobacter sp.]|nr:methyl-accepting chemotaxis protein [Geobacter sp.]